MKIFILDLNFALSYEDLDTIHLHLHNLKKQEGDYLDFYFNYSLQL